MENLQFMSVEVKDKIAYVTLDRKPANALVEPMYAEIARVFYELNVMDDVAIVVLRAAGKIFIAGNDISDFPKFNNRVFTEEYIETIARAATAVWNCKKPVIAAVQGACIGAGLVLSMLCDFIIAGEGVKFSLPEVNMGIPAAGCSALLGLPYHAAKYLALTGEALTAETLHQYGTVLKVVPKEDVWAEAEAFAKGLTKKCYRAAGIHKTIMNTYLGSFRDRFIMEQHSFMDQMMGTHDFKEAAAAFLEKREPVFTGK